MNRLRLFVCSASLVVALTPLAAFAKTTPQHAQDELANGQAQLADAQQVVSDLQVLAQQDAANSRMIALLHSEALRQQQLNNVANGNALEQLASSMATAALDQGNINAQNDLQIAQNRAAALIAIADANVANGQMLAQTKGRWDELANAQAQAALLHQAADFITGQQAQLNVSNDEQIAREQADALQASGTAEAQNSDAMGANDVLAADAVLSAGELDATSAEISDQAKGADELAHAEASLANDEAMVKEASEP
jgi:hypothetical protein